MPVAFEKPIDEWSHRNGFPFYIVYFTYLKREFDIFTYLDKRKNTSIKKIRIVTAL